MPKNKYLTNRELLAELEKRLSEFTQDELTVLMKIMSPHQPKIMKLIQSAHPQIHDWIQEKHSQLEQERTDKEIDQLKKSLDKPKENSEKATNYCQECNTSILPKFDEKGRPILELYGQWTGKGYKIVCQNCLEKNNQK